MKKFILTFFCCMTAAFFFNGCAYKLDTYGKDYSNLKIQHSKPVFLEKVCMKVFEKEVLSNELRQNLIQKYPNVYTENSSGVPAAELLLDVQQHNSDDIFCKVVLTIGDLKSERTFKIIPALEPFRPEKMLDDQLLAIYADCGAEFTNDILNEAYLSHPKMFPVVMTPPGK